MGFISFYAYFRNTGYFQDLLYIPQFGDIMIVSQGDCKAVYSMRNMMSISIEQSLTRSIFFCPIIFPSNIDSPISITTRKSVLNLLYLFFIECICCDGVIIFCCWVWDYTCTIGLSFLCTN